MDKEPIQIDNCGNMSVSLGEDIKLRASSRGIKWKKKKKSHTVWKNSIILIIHFANIHKKCTMFHILETIHTIILISNLSTNDHLHMSPYVIYNNSIMLISTHEYVIMPYLSIHKS